MILPEIPVGRNVCFRPKADISEAIFRRNHSRVGVVVPLQMTALGRKQTLGGIALWRGLLSSGLGWVADNRLRDNGLRASCGSTRSVQALAGVDAQVDVAFGVRGPARTSRLWA